MIPFACDMTALSSEQRARYQELAIQLRAVLREVCELSDGYEFEFPLDTTTYAALAEITPLDMAAALSLPSTYVWTPRSVSFGA